MVSIPAKDYDTSSLLIPATDVHFWSISVTVIVPLAVIILGFGIWMKRRKQ